MKETDTKGADAVKPFTYDHAFWSTEPADPHSWGVLESRLNLKVLSVGRARSEWQAPVCRSNAEYATIPQVGPRMYRELQERPFSVL